MDCTSLKLISSNLFILDKDAQIEFIKDSKGQYSGIKIFVNDGSILKKRKTIILLNKGISVILVRPFYGLKLKQLNKIITAS